MQDVSSTGIAFWSKKKLDTYTSIHLRLFDGSGPGPWLPARVKHVTVGIRGNLIGAEFQLDG